MSFVRTVAPGFFSARRVKNLQRMLRMLVLLAPVSVMAEPLAPLSPEEVNKVREDIAAMIRTSVVGVSDFVVHEATPERMQRLMAMPEFSQMSDLEKSNALIIAGLHNQLTFERMSDIVRKMATWFPGPVQTFRTGKLSSGQGGIVPYNMKNVVVYGPAPEWQPESASFVLAWHCTPEAAWVQPDRFPFFKQTAAQRQNAINSADTARPFVIDNSNINGLQFGRCVQELRQEYGLNIPYTAAQQQAMRKAVVAQLTSVFARQLQTDRCTGTGPDDCVFLLLLWSDLSPDDKRLADAVRMLEGDVGLARPTPDAPASKASWSNEVLPEGDRSLREGTFLRAKASSILAAPAAWPKDALRKVKVQIADWEQWCKQNLPPSGLYGIEDDRNEFANPHVPFHRKRAGLSVNGLDKTASAKPAARGKAVAVPPRTGKISSAGPFDKVAPDYTRISWLDPLNPDFADLGNDELLLRTTKGLSWWDIQQNRFLSVEGGPYPADRTKLFGSAPVPTGAVVVAGSLGVLQRGPTPDETPYALIYWDRQQRRIAASLPWSLPDARRDDDPALHAVGTQVLACYATANKDEYKARVLDVRDGRLAWIGTDGADVRANLQEGHVAGEILLGDTTISVSSNAPVAFSTRTCRWTFTVAPGSLPADKSFMLGPPVFLADGKVLVSSVSWRDETTHYFPHMLLWAPAEKRWLEAGPSFAEERSHWVDLKGYRAIWRRVNDYLEVFDDQNLRWIRSDQRIDPEWIRTSGDISSLFPLSDGRVLLMNRNSSSSSPDYGKGSRVAVFSARRDARAIKGRLAFGHGDDAAFPTGDGRVLFTGTHNEVVDIAKGTSHEVPPLPVSLKYPTVLTTLARELLVTGALPESCKWTGRTPDDGLADAEKCPLAAAFPLYRLGADASAWTSMTDVSIPFVRGDFSLGGKDMLMRRNGEMVFLSGKGTQEWAIKEKTPDYSRSTTQLMQWGKSRLQPLALLKRARTGTTLIDLRDGRLAAIGGREQLRRAATPEFCTDDPRDEYCPYILYPSNTTEVYDRKSGRWSFGPAPRLPGGEAVRLANGRIIKIGTTECPSSPGVCGEAIGPDFRVWKKLPELKGDEYWRPERMFAAGNRVILVPQDRSDRQVTAWNDDRQQWETWKQWPARKDWSYILPADARHALVVYWDRSFGLVQYP